MQIDLLATQISRLEGLSLQLSITKNELVRRAVDQFLDVNVPASTLSNKEQRIKSTVGIWTDKTEMVNPVDFVKKQRVSRF